MAIKYNKFGFSTGIHLASSGAVLAGILAAQQAAAEDVESVDEAKQNEPRIEVVVVQGSKLNLKSAQAIKRDADTFVDAISASEIGVLPDRSVLDAIQRIPGVAIERFVGPNDPDHFSVEGSGIILRGMVQTRSEFNGRDSFTANSGRGLSFQDVPQELMAGVEVYKNQTADMIEGGIGGTITLQTRKPFDSDERVLAFSVDYSYGDLAKEASPTFSGLYSDRWDTGVGEFGFLFNYANSTLYGESNGIQSDTFVPYYAEDLVTEGYHGSSGRAQDFVGEDGQGIVQMPNATNLLIKEDDRTREGIAAALQFKNTDETMLATFQYMRSDASLAWNERAVKYQGGYYDIGSRQSEPLTGTHFLFDDEGLFQSGTITNGSNTWRAANGEQNRVPRPSGGLYEQWGHKTQMDSRLNETQTLIEDFSLNLQWNPIERFELIADFQYIQAETSNDDMAVHINTWASFDYDIRGETPSLTLIEPWHGVRDDARQKGEDTYEEGYPGFSGDEAGDSNFFQDPNSYYWSSVMDHYERSEGDSSAFRLDSTYDFEGDGFFKSVKAGIRYAKREQTVRLTEWNWGATSPEWKRNVGWLTNVESQEGGYEVVDWSNFMHGNVVNIPGNGTLHANEDFIRSLIGKNPSRNELYNNNPDNLWHSYPSRDVLLEEDPNLYRELDAEFGIFSQGEMNKTIETRNAAYLRLDFSGDTDLVFSGNIGLRYLDMDREAIGAVIFPDLIPEAGEGYSVPEELNLPLDPYEARAYLNVQVAEGQYDSLEDAINSADNRWLGDEKNYLSGSERGFGNAVEQVVKANTSSHLFLPSFNFKIELTDTLITRFAFAKAISFPNMDDVRNRVVLSETEIITTLISDDPLSPIEDRQIQTAEVEGWNGGGGNPYIQPMESIQYDASLEWYFSDVGQLSGSIFHKNLSNYFVQGVDQQAFVNPVTGATYTADITSTKNGGKGKLDGVEISYHQFFEGMFEGFGVQATYTFVDATGIPNNEVDVEDERWYDSRYEDTGIRVQLDSIPLQGQSDHTVNVAGMYETNKWNARLAYNWRSQYLLTTRDVISKAPQWYGDHGELDGSVFYNITDNFTVGLQATNITNAQSEIIMILDDELTSTGRSWFMADRRVALVFRGKF